MSQATLLWGVFMVKGQGPDERQRLVALGSSRSAAVRWRGEHVATRRSRIQRLSRGESPAPAADTAAVSIGHVRRLARWHRPKRTTPAGPRLRVVRPHRGGPQRGCA